MAYCGAMNQGLDDPAIARRLMGLRIVQSVGIIVGGADLILAWLRYQHVGALALFPAAAGLVGLLAAAIATSRSRAAYRLLLGAAALSLLDLVSGYVHALFFLGAFMIIAALAAINEPDDDEALTIRNIMEND